MRTTRIDSVFQLLKRGHSGAAQWRAFVEGIVLSTYFVVGLYRITSELPESKNQNTPAAREWRTNTHKQTYTHTLTHTDTHIHARTYTDTYTCRHTCNPIVPGCTWIMNGFEL